MATDTIARGLAVRGLAQSGVNSIPGVKNWGPRSLTKWRKALAAMRAGTGDAVLTCLGPSTVVGSGGAGVSGYPGARPYSWPTQLTTILNQRGIPTHADNCFGDQGVVAGGSTLPLYDTRVALGSGWVTNAPSSHWAIAPGNCWTNVTNTTGAFALTPAGSFDKIDIYYITGGGFGTFKVDVDGGAALVTQSTAGSSGVAKVTATCAAGTHTINITPTVQGNGVFIYGVDTRLTTAPKVSVRSFGMAGGSTTWFAANALPWQGVAPFSVLGSHLTLVDLCINDVATTPISIALYRTQLDYIVSTIIAGGGDVILVKCFPGDNSGIYPNADGATFLAFQAVIDDIATTYNCPVIDWKYRWQSYAVSNALGYYFDALHPTATGYADVGEHVASLLTRPT